jgi:(2Fe-2S) ferredoxin
MRYEEMLADPFATFGRLARHMLLRPTDAQLHDAIERSSFENLRKQEDERSFKEKPEKAERFFREGKAGQWHQTLDRRQVRRVVQRHHVEMRRFGYLTDDLRHMVPDSE